MKKQVTYLIMILLLFLPLMVSAQQKTVDEKKKAEMELQMKKQEEEARKKQAEMERQIHIITESQAQKAEEIEKAMKEARLNYAFALDEGTGWTTLGPEGNVRAFYSPSPNSTSIEYSRRLQESTMKKDFVFDVDKDTKRASISVSGACEVGEIKIQIMLPNGKQYTEVLIDRYGSVNWNKTFTIEDEKDEKIGTWKFIITTKEANGNFRLGLRSN